MAGFVQHDGDVCLDDALRLELTNSTTDPAVMGWKDCEFVYNKTDKPANDAAPNP